MSTDIRSVILGAGRPFRGAEPSALHGTSGNGRVLDWLLGALPGPTAFISGYGAEEVRSQYPQLHYTHNEHWETSGATASLLLAPALQSEDAAQGLLVSYADIVFQPDAVQRLLAIDADVALACDSQWLHRYSGRDEADLQRCEKLHVVDGRVTRLGAELDTGLANAEFVGLVHFSADVAAYLQRRRAEIDDRFGRDRLSVLIEWLRMEGFSVAAVDLAGDWAELNEPKDLAHFVLGTKAQTLQRLQAVVQRSRIEEQCSFRVGQWREDSAEVLARISQQFAGRSVVVRSSALSEDGFASANAGAYESLLDVPVDMPDVLQTAVEQVIASYPDDDAANEVLVQPMLLDVRASGVAFTRTLNNGAPWMVINYDDSSGSTDSITSGGAGEHGTFLMRRDHEGPLTGLPSVMQALVPTLREIEALLDYDALDVEFAMTGDDHQVHVLQVRPIAVDHAAQSVDDERIYRQLKQAEARFLALQSAAPMGSLRPGVDWGPAVFGRMPDWNPAEIIGTAPGRLATSLYRYLIMDETWARQRAEYGYRDLRPQPLLQSFAGHPYVDVRASFASFIPANLDDALAGRLVTFYLQCLLRHPELHDKVEFDVVPTCHALDFPRWAERLQQEGGFSGAEIDQLETGLREITRHAFERSAGDLAAIDTLEQRFTALQQTQLPPLHKACALLEDCREQGTLPFAHLARSAFVAVTLLRSAVSQGVISAAARDDFLAGIRTVSHRFAGDARACGDGALDWETFVARYGHLRPGSYEIGSPCYASDPERFLRPIVAAQKAEPEAASSGTGAWQQERDAFFRALQQAGLIDGVASGGPFVEQFLQQAIEGREYAKFVFTRNLSAALECLADWGAALGLGREQLSALDLGDCFGLARGTQFPDDVAAWLKQRAAEGADWQACAERIELPPLISQVSDFSLFSLPPSEANFVGRGQVTAPCVDLQASGSEVDVTGCIVLLPQADPGYDWLFGQGISGLITLYGGANSHMAIRAAEFGLPAAIGIGEVAYRELAGASMLVLDADRRQIHRVQ